MKATEVRDGVSSAMRIALLVYCLPLGALLIVGGMVGWFCHLPDASLIIGTGAGLIMAALGAKAWQAQAEERRP